jgi:hypothetical protein
MRMFAMFMALVVLVCTVPVQAGLITPSGASDARASRDWGNGFSASYWVDSEGSQTLGVYYDPSDSSYRWWNVAVMEFPISSLAGQENLDVSLNIYFDGVSGPGVYIRSCGADDNGVVEPTDWLNRGSTLTTLSAGTSGWVSVDVSSDIQSLADSGASWAVFSVRAANWYGGATVRASEYTYFSPNLNVAPEPASFALLTIGGLAMLRRKRSV